MWPLEAGEVVFAIDTDNSPFDTLAVEIDATAPIFVFNACDTDSLVTYCVTGRVCIEDVVRGESFLVLMDWDMDHQDPWEISVNCFPYENAGETCEDAIEILGNMVGVGVCTAGHHDDYSFMDSCGLYVPGGDVVYKLCLGPGGHFEATLQTECVNWSALYLFTDCEDPSGSCVAAAVDMNPTLPDMLQIFYDNGASPDEIYLVIDSACDTAHSDGFGGHMSLSVSFDPCPPERVCCFPDGACTLMFDPVECEMASGMWHPEWDSCDPNPCEGSGIEDYDFPLGTHLFPAEPNPFADRTLIRFSLAQAMHVRLEIFDPSGRILRQLLSDQAEAGPTAIEWDGCNESGAHVGPGTYFCRMHTGNRTLTQRIVLMQR